MYFVDTYKSCIWEFRTDDRGVPVKNGSGAYEKREVVKVPQEEGIPDGMTIDRQAFHHSSIIHHFCTWHLLMASRSSINT